MDWACPYDQLALQQGRDELSCPHCDARFEISDGIPIFATGQRAGVARAAGPELEELWERMKAGTSDEAAEWFCRTRGATRSPFSTDWKFFFSRPGHGRVLEIGAGFGDDTLDLAQRGPVTAIAPNLTGARIVRRNFADRSAGKAQLAVVPNLGRLPLADASIDAIALEDAAASSFGLTGGTLPVVALEWRRVLAPGGTVFLGVANGLYRTSVLRRLRAVATSPAGESLNRRVKRADSPRAAGLGLGPTLGGMARAGFPAPEIFAPFPDESRAQVVVPVDDRQVVRYFLNNLVRQNSAMVRAGIRVANVLVSLGQFRRFVPYYYLLYRRET